MATVETEGITDFFVRLGSDESLLADYMRDPRHGLESANLDQQSAATLLGGDLDAVRSVVEGEVATDNRLRRIITAPRMMIAGDDEEDEDKPDRDEPEPDKREPEPEKHEPHPDEHDSRARQLVG
jgi:hypothetical protein